MPVIRHERSGLERALLPLSALLVVLILFSCGNPEADRAARQAEKQAARAAEAERRREAREAEARARRPSAEASHQKMLEKLAAISASSLATNPFFGDAQLEAIEAKLGQAEKLDPVEHIQLLLDKSANELRLGFPQEAVNDTELAYSKLLTLPREMIASAEPQLLVRAGTAHLRAAEVANCVGQHNPESCILPLQGGGVHRDKRGSQNAKQYFLRALELAAPGSTEQIEARWLLNITAMTLGEYPQGIPEAFRIAPEAFGPEGVMPRFQNIANETGLATRDLSGGVVIDDLDGDDDLDILTSTWDPTGNLHYFRNDGEKGFVDATEEAGLIGFMGGLNMIHADYDNDGDVDVVVLRGAWMRAMGRMPNSLLRNRGDGSFEDVAYFAGIAGEDYPTQAAAFADYDNDGDLDLYFGNETTDELRAPSQLFRNDGDGTFTDVAKEAGVENLRYAKGVAWGDIDGDGNVDLYVSNLGDENRLYRNDGQGHFVDIAQRAGVASPRFSFPCWFFDFDNDGNLDIYCAAYIQNTVPNAVAYMGAPSPEHGRLFKGKGDGSFVDVSAQAGLDRLVTTMGANFGDLDNDGFLDFYLGTGFPAYEGLFPNVMYRNMGGRGFIDVTRSGGFGHLQKGHGIAFADLDNDGDLDIFEQMGGAFPGDSFMNAVYRNPGFKAHQVGLQLVGKDSNRSAIGARVMVVTERDGKRHRIYRSVGPRGSFGSAPQRLLVGLGLAEEIRRIEIYWPRTGKTQVVKGLELDQTYRIREDQDTAEKIILTSFAM